MIEYNINLLQENQFNWVGLAEEKDINLLFEKEDRNEAIFVTKSGEKRVIQDVFAEDFQGNKFKKQLIFIFGLSNIKEIKKVIKSSHKESYFIIIEPNMALFNMALHTKKLDFFTNPNCILFVDQNLDNLIEFIHSILNPIEITALAKNTAFYFNDYYRKYDTKILKQLLHNLRHSLNSGIRMRGNDILDGLQGLEQNIANIEFLSKSRDIQYLKNAFPNTPAIVVAAGPSLNKNIDYLHRLKGKAIIIAVDTILEKLLNMNIIPDFVCTVERVEEIYEYFYKDKKIPSEVTFVGPLLVNQKVLQEFPGELILPMRYEVAEYKWLGGLFDFSKDSGILMGLSCAHVAYGLAVHLGCSPIILVGQDLAYGENELETHASGTYTNMKDQQPETLEAKEEIDGYYGEKVISTPTWTMFKNWYENKIPQNPNQVINSTEGGAAIKHTIQRPLLELVESFENNESINISEKVRTIPFYNVDKEIISEKFTSELKFLNEYRTANYDYLENLKALEINSLSIKKKLSKIVNQLSKFDDYVLTIMRIPIVLHNVQSMVIKCLWDYNSVEDIMNVENLEFKLNVQKKLVIVVIETINRMIELLEGKVQELT